MKPYPQTNSSDRKSIFNCRLSRMRRIGRNVSDASGSQFRVFTTATELSPEKSVTIKLATAALLTCCKRKAAALY